MNRRRRMSGIALLIGVFLAGFLPQSIRAHRLARQLEEARSFQQLCRARDLLGTVFLEISFKNYGLAQNAATSLFEQVRKLSGQAQTTEVNQALSRILSARDEVTARLARGDPASYGLVQSLYQTLLSASNLPAARAGS